MATARSKSLGQRLKERRLLHGLTLSQVGARLGLANGNFVGMVERGERAPSDERLLTLAEILDLPARELLTLKYADSDRSEVGALLAPQPPTFPRLRRFMLGTCLAEAAVRVEFERGARTTFERLAWHGLAHHLIIPALDSDSLAPRRLREHLDSWRHRLRRDPTVPLDAGFFERQADMFVPWARTRFEGWDADLTALTMRIVHSRHDETHLSLEPHQPQGPLPSTAPLDLPGLLDEQGLDRDDIDEIVTIVELKKRRRARNASPEEKSRPPS